MNIAIITRFTKKLNMIALSLQRPFYQFGRIWGQYFLESCRNNFANLWVAIFVHSNACTEQYSQPISHVVIQLNIYDLLQLGSPWLVKLHKMLALCSKSVMEIRFRGILVTWDQRVQVFLHEFTRDLFLGYKDKLIIPTQPLHCYTQSNVLYTRRTEGLEGEIRR